MQPKQYTWVLARMLRYHVQLFGAKVVVGGGGGVTRRHYCRSDQTHGISEAICSDQSHSHLSTARLHSRYCSDMYVTI